MPQTRELHIREILRQKAKPNNTEPVSIFFEYIVEGEPVAGQKDYFEVSYLKAPEGDSSLVLADLSFTAADIDKHEGYYKGTLTPSSNWGGADGNNGFVIVVRHSEKEEARSFGKFCVYVSA